MVRKALHLFFRSDVKLRVQGGMRVEFVDGQDAPQASPQQKAAEARRAELALIIGELAQCLDADPDIRPELRHLAYVETLLRQQGLAALEALPVDVLRRALEQFEGLVSNWAPKGLATLRSMMAVAVRQRSESGQEAGASTPVP